MNDYTKEQLAKIVVFLYEISKLVEKPISYTNCGIALVSAKYIESLLEDKIVNE